MASIVGSIASALGWTRPKPLALCDVFAGPLPDALTVAATEVTCVGALARPADDGVVQNSAGWRWRWDDGEKFAGGFGLTELLRADYWTLRSRSVQLFEQNLYARGIIRRLVTNEIHTGLHLEATPDEKLLGYEEEALSDWCEDVESRFEVWASSPWLCDHKERQTFGELQQTLRMHALIEGDVLVMLIQDKTTGLPRINVVVGSRVQTPIGVDPRAGSRICHGVELDSNGRQVAYWITQDDGTSKRVPAYGEKSGRKLAWLVYGTDKRQDEVRGKPFLSLLLQSLREIDRYRDAVQRKAVITSMLAMFIKKTQDKPSASPISGMGATLRGTDVQVDSTGTPRRFNMAEGMPGAVLEELQHGEEPVTFGHNVATEGYGDFEAAIVQCIAWTHEIPPEILTLSFNSNYSASKAANNEFDMYLSKTRWGQANAVCRPVYAEWLVASLLTGEIKAKGLLESWRSSRNYATFGAWSASDWPGQVKPSIDLPKQVLGYKAMVNEGFITRKRSARELTGTNFKKNVRILKRENEALAETNLPLAQVDQDAFTAELEAAQTKTGDDEPNKEQAPPPRQGARLVRVGAADAR